MIIDVKQLALGAAMVFIFISLISAMVQKYVPAWPFPGSSTEWSLLSMASAILAAAA